MLVQEMLFQQKQLGIITKSTTKTITALLKLMINGLTAISLENVVLYVEYPAYSYMTLNWIIIAQQILIFLPS